MRAVEFSTKSEITHANRMEKATSSHLRTITNGKLAEIAVANYLQNEGLSPKDNNPDFRIYTEKKHRDIGDLCFKESDKIIDVKASEFYSKWLMVKEADMCMGFLSDIYIFCTPNADFPPKLGDDYDVERGSDLQKKRELSFKKFFLKYPNLDLRESTPSYKIYGGAPLSWIVAEEGEHPPKAVGPIKNVDSSNLPPYSKYSKHYSKRDFERYRKKIPKTGGSNNKLNNYNRFLHSDLLDPNIKELICSDKIKVDKNKIKLFFDLANEDVEKTLTKDEYLKKREEKVEEPEVDLKIEEYELECEECNNNISSVSDGNIIVESRKQKNISREKLAGISRAFFGEELCFDCLIKEAGQKPPINLKLHF